MNQNKTIHIQGAEEHNLKSIDVEFERGKITTVTGVSGSGKSSLVFDTLLSESQRRFFYTLSHYARQFLSADEKPKFRRIDGLSPSVGLAQNETLLSRRSSVATESDLGELFGVAFAKYGNYTCPTHGLDTASQTVEAVTEKVISNYKGKVVAICAQIIEQRRGHYRSELESYAQKGYTKALIDQKVVSLTPIPELEKSRKHSIAIIIDCVKATPTKRSRIEQSILAASNITQDQFGVIEAETPQSFVTESWQLLSLKSGCPKCGYSWADLDSRHFSPNSLGKCNICKGLGSYEDTEEESSIDGYQACIDCKGTGLDAKLKFVQIENKSILDCYTEDLSSAHKFWSKITKASTKKPALKRLSEEICSGLQQMAEIGIGYLSLARRLPTLSGGELQRLKLSTLFSESLHGLIYILDEPSQGLHESEVHGLMKKLQNLTTSGSTVIIVDHDELIMKMSDFIIELGPQGGRRGGHLVAQFPTSESKKWAAKSITAKYLSEYQMGHHLKHRVAKAFPKKPNSNWVTLNGLSLNCLQIKSVSFKRHSLNVVTGVSGAGKSSLVFGTLFPALSAARKGQLTNLSKLLGNHLGSIHGADDQISIDAIDRRPMGRSRLSMPVTYLGAYTAIRQLFASLPDAQIMGITAKDLSLLSKGGRCEDCKGRGYIELSMKFLSDAKVTCTSCLGKRFGMMVLQIRYLGKNLNDVLNMTILEASEVFKSHPSICKRLQPAIDLGLGYLQLGQPVITLSGGEAQRIRLAPYFGKKKDENSYILMDEPTQGLHSKDVDILIDNLATLTQKGITIVVVEHHPALEKSADWVIELGPEAGAKGGRITFHGENHSQS